jgi:hypothetical protein
MVQREEEFLNGIEDFGSVMNEINKENELLAEEKEKELKRNENGGIEREEEVKKEKEEKKEKKERKSFFEEYKPLIIVGGIGIIIVPTLLYLVLSGKLVEMLGGSTQNPPKQTQQVQTQPNPNIPQNYYSSNPKGNYAYSPIDKEKLTEEIKEEIMKDIQIKIETQQEKIKSIVNTLKNKLNEIEKQVVKNTNKIERNTQTLRKAEKDIEIVKEQISKIENVLKDTSQKVKNLEEINKPLKTQKLISLGSLEVDYYTDTYITLNGNNYWIGDKIPIVQNGKQKLYTIIKIRNGMLIVEDDFGNKYKIKLII